MNPPWPVLLLARSLDIGGTERQVAELARALDRNEFQPHVAAFHTTGMRGTELRNSGVPVVEFPVRSFSSPSVLSAAWQMGAYCRANGISIVHPFDPPTVMFSVPVARLFRVPVVLSSQRGERSFCTPGTRWSLSLTDHLVDGIVVNAEFLRRELRDRFRVADKHIFTCYNGLDPRIFHPEGRRRPEFLTAASCVVGCVAALRPEKSLTTLLDAAAILLPKHPGLKVMIVGGGECEHSLPEYARKLGISGACHFQPATADVAPWYRAIDIFVLPSLTEAFSNSVMEAIACGCCPVVTRVGGNPELVEDGESGLLFEPGSSADLVAKLEPLLTDPVRPARLTANAIRRVEKDFTLSVAAAQFAALYRRLLSLAQ